MPQNQKKFILISCTHLNLIQGKTLFQIMKKNIHQFCCVPCILYKELAFYRQPEQQIIPSCFQLGTLRIRYPHSISQTSYLMESEWNVVLALKTFRVMYKAECSRFTFCIHIMYEKINVQIITLRILRFSTCKERISYIQDIVLTKAVK